LLQAGHFSLQKQQKIILIHHSITVANSKKEKKEQTSRWRFFYQAWTAHRLLKGPKMSVFVPGDLDLQTHPSDGLNKSSAWIWHKSVQQFRRYFTQKQKPPQTDDAKNTTFHSANKQNCTQWHSHILTPEQQLLNTKLLILEPRKHNMSDKYRPKPISLAQLVKSLQPNVEKIHW